MTVVEERKVVHLLITSNLVSPRTLSAAPRWTSHELIHHPRHAQSTRNPVERAPGARVHLGEMSGKVGAYGTTAKTVSTSVDFVRLPRTDGSCVPVRHLLS